MNKYIPIIIVVIIAIQIIPTNRENPPVTADFDGPAEVKEIFKTSCYDCHSNETKWQWYHKVAPTSWLVAYNVKEGREEFNFSNWQNISRSEILELRKKIWEEVKEGKMPMKIHTIIHRDAVLTKEQKELIKDWSVNL